MALSRPNEENMFSNLIGELGPDICPVPPHPSSSHSGQQAMVWPSDTTRHESTFPRADPERVFITTLLPHVPDLPPGIPPALQSRLVRAICNAWVEAIYGPVGAEVLYPRTHNVLSNQSVFNAALHEYLASLYPNAGQQAIHLQLDDRQLAIAKFREDHHRAITFDDEDDEEYFPNSLPSQQFSTTTLIHATSPAFQSIDMGLVYYPTVQAFDPNSSKSKPLDPAAPAFEYQPKNRHVQDIATEADQEAAQAQEPIPEVPAPEFPAEAASAPATRPHVTPKGTIRLRDLYHHPDNVKKREKAAQRERAALGAQSRGLSNGGGIANGNRAPRSQKPQNGSSAPKLSSGPYGSTRPPRGPSGSNSSTGPSSTNGSPRPRRPHSNTPSPACSGPSTPPRTGSNSPTTPATTDTSLSTSPAPSLSPPRKLKDTAGSPNSVRRPATPGPSRGSRTPTGTTGAVRTCAGGATPQLSPPAPTTGTAGVSAATTSNSRGDSDANSLRQSLQAGNAESSTSAGQSSKAAARSPTQVPTQTGASNGAAGAEPSTGRRSVPVEPARIGDRESAVPTRLPTPRPTQTSTGQGSVDAEPSAEESRAQAVGTGRNLGHEIYEVRRGKVEAMRGRWRRGG
ncbi:hypothetical protein V498_04542 [Pseudogymnoascus sp. VKM F-4517 (FW-2822)]|nr:hypothetical protein V498_04542 [Pseudogymnoascus sp. VKM F-4517 (FW-2822)]